MTSSKIQNTIINMKLHNCLVKIMPKYYFIFKTFAQYFIHIPVLGHDWQIVKLTLISEKGLPLNYDFLAILNHKL